MGDSRNSTGDLIKDALSAVGRIFICVPTPEQILCSYVKPLDLGQNPIQGNDIKDGVEKLFGSGAAYITISATCLSLIALVF